MQRKWNSGGRKEVRDNRGISWQCLRKTLYTWQRSKILGVSGLIITEHKDENADKKGKAALKSTKKTVTEGHRLLFPPSNVSEIELREFKRKNDRQETWKATANATVFSNV